MKKNLPCATSAKSVGMAKIEVAKPAVAVSLSERLHPAETLVCDSLHDTGGMKGQQGCEADAPLADTSGRSQHSTVLAPQHETIASVDGVAKAPPGKPKATVTKLQIAPKTIPIEGAEAVAERERTIKGECFYELGEDLFYFGCLTTIDVEAPTLPVSNHPLEI